MAPKGTVVGDLFGPGHVLVKAKILQRASFSKRAPGPRKPPVPQKHIFGGLGPMCSDSPVRGPCVLVICDVDKNCGFHNFKV